MAFLPWSSLPSTAQGPRGPCPCFLLLNSKLSKLFPPTPSVEGCAQLLHYCMAELTVPQLKTFQVTANKVDS